MPKIKQKTTFKLPKETAGGELIIFDEEGKSYHLTSEIPQNKKDLQKEKIIVENYLNRLFQERQKTTENENIKIIDEWIETFSEILLIMEEKN